MEPPFSTQYQDIYFCRANGLDEKRHVFQRGNNLPARYVGRSDFVIAEAGFGTGLSFLGTAQDFLAATDRTQFLHFFSFEAHPMAADAMRDALSPWREVLGSLIEELVRQLPIPIPGWHRLVLGGRVILTLVYGDINDTMPHFNVPVDAWYLDGFNPAKNPAMWGDVLFNTLVRCSVIGATAASYSAARVVKDGLVRAGFHVQKQKGFGYKSDMVTANFNGSTCLPAATNRGLRVAVLGGGLAATATAWALKQAGQVPFLIAPHGLADGASGNPRGLYNPRFSARLTLSAQFYSTAFAQFHAFLAAHDPCITGWDASGALHLMRNRDTTDKLRGAANNWGWGDQMMVLDADAASQVAGITIKHDALWLPHGGSVDPRKICALYADGIPLRSDMPPNETYDAIVIASGLAVRDHPALANIPFKTVRGQMVQVTTNDIAQRIKTHLCYGGYITPAQNGVHTMGATFTRDDDQIDVRSTDTGEVLQKAMDHLGSMPMVGHKDVCDARAGIRVTTPDHLPVIGPIQVGNDTPVWISAAHGSHGLLSTHLGGHMIAAAISGAPSMVPSNLSHLVSPQRFMT